MVDAESLRLHPKFQVNIKIQLNTARISRLSFRFLWYDYALTKEAKDQTSWFVKIFFQYTRKNTASIACVLK